MKQAGLPSNTRHDRGIQLVSIASHPNWYDRTAVHDRLAASLKNVECFDSS